MGFWTYATEFRFTQLVYSTDGMGKKTYLSMSSWGFAKAPAHNMTSFRAKHKNVWPSLRLSKKTPSTFGFLPLWWDTARRETGVLGQICKWALRSSATDWGINASMVLWRSPDALVVRSIVPIPIAGSLGELISAMWGSPIRFTAWYTLESGSISRFLEWGELTLTMREAWRDTHRSFGSSRVLYAS